MHTALGGTGIRKSTGEILRAALSSTLLPPPAVWLLFLAFTSRPTESMSKSQLGRWLVAHSHKTGKQKVIRVLLMQPSSVSIEKSIERTLVYLSAN